MNNHWTHDIQQEEETKQDLRKKSNMFATAVENAKMNRPPLRHIDLSPVQAAQDGVRPFPCFETPKFKSLSTSSGSSNKGALQSPVECVARRRISSISESIILESVVAHRDLIGRPTIFNTPFSGDKGLELPIPSEDDPDSHSSQDNGSVKRNFNLSTYRPLSPSFRYVRYNFIETIDLEAGSDEEEEDEGSERRDRSMDTESVLKLTEIPLKGLAFRDYCKIITILLERHHLHARVDELQLSAHAAQH